MFGLQYLKTEYTIKTGKAGKWLIPSISGSYERQSSTPVYPWKTADEARDYASGLYATGLLNVVQEPGPEPSA